MTLSALKSSHSLIGVVALDEAYTLADLLGLSLKEPSNEQLLNEVLALLIEIHSKQASGMVLDPVYSLPLLEESADNAVILARLEQVQEPDPLIVPKLIKNWGIKEVRNMYGLAKLELYYHPEEEKALEKKQFVAELYDFCEIEEIDFLVKLMIYNPNEEKMTATDFQEAQLAAVNELQRSASVLALQYPQDPLAAATLTSGLDTPWLLVSDDVPYDKFKEQLRVAIENGAEGFLAGEVLWQEIEGMRQEDQSPDLEKIKEFIKTESKDRIIELMRIVQEDSADGSQQSQ
jgi:tagatose-1,6-bisphosphate aldolase